MIFIVSKEGYLNFPQFEWHIYLKWIMPPKESPYTSDIDLFHFRKFTGTASQPLATDKENTP